MICLYANDFIKFKPNNKNNFPKILKNFLFLKYYLVIILQSMIILYENNPRFNIYNFIYLLNGKQTKEYMNILNLKI